MSVTSELGWSIWLTSRLFDYLIIAALVWVFARQAVKSALKSADTESE